MTADKAINQLPDERAGIVKFGISNSSTVVEDEDRVAPLTIRAKRM
jgi:hypothetical protein